MRTSEKKNVIVTASAGTGKTYRLVSEYVDSKIHPRFILALTFTDKAAAEMRERIGARDQTLQRALSSSCITTYHSFCAKVLREFADRARIDSRFSLLDPFEDEELARKVAKQTILRQLESNREALLSLVARLQLEGSDQTKGVVGHLIRIREQLIESGESPQSVSSFLVPEPDLLRASEEFQNALTAIRHAMAAYQSIWAQLSENAKERINNASRAIEELQEVFVSCTKVSTYEVKLSFIFEKLKKQISGRFGPDELRRNLIASVAQVGMLICASFLTLEEGAFLDLLKEFWVDLENEKKQKICLGFSDLLVLTRRLLRDDLATRNELKGRFRYVLVDEYQDTSPIQEEIVALLCESPDEERHLGVSEKALGTIRLEPGKLFVVGDPKQSIYGFRGADVSLFKRMAEEILAQGGEQEALNISRRSSNAVVQIVNAAVDCPTQEKLEALREGNNLGGAVLRTKNEAAAITREIVSLLSAQSQVAGAGSFEPKDIAILVRRIKKAAPILRSLIAAGVPARLFGGEGFFERQEVIELISALHLALEPADSLALLTVMRSGLLRFSDFEFPKMFEALKEQGVGWTVDAVASALGTCEFDAGFRERFEKLYLVLVSIRQRAEQISVAEALDLLLSKTDYGKTLALEDDAGLCFANVRKLQDLALLCEGDFKAQINELTVKMRRAPKEALGEEDVESNAVRIMTIHQSKGLEFPVVFVADTAAAIPSDSDDCGFDPECGFALSYRGRPIAVSAPSTKELIKIAGTPIQKIRAKRRERNESELSRLLYVALTRARDLLYFVDVQELDEKIVDRGQTLRKLFFEGYDAQAGDFKSLMPVINDLSSNVEPKFELQLRNPIDDASIVQTKSIKNDRQNSSRRLLFASDLLTAPVSTDAELRSQRLKHTSRESLESKRTSHTESGRLSHRLIQLACEQTTDDEFSNKDDLNELFKACLRLEGYEVSRECNQLIDDCRATLETVIWPLRKAGFAFRFEVPMQYQTQKFVIKGCADAIATRNDQVCVIDFKSSPSALQSTRTQLQLKAYCSSILQSNQEMQIFFAACMIGNNKSLDFVAFEPDHQRELEEHIDGLP